MNYENGIKELADKIQEIRLVAYDVYRPLVNDICSRNASENEIEHLLDYLMDFCGYEEFLLLFKNICRQYFFQYPKMISDYIYFCRELYDEEDC